MKVNTAKKITLAILSLVLVYIWWGNRGLLLPNTETAGVSVSEPSDQPPAASRRPPLAYREPQVNPFKRKEDVTPVSTATVQPNRDDAPRELLSTAYSLAGVLQTEQAAQAIMMTDTGRSSVLSSGDSLGPWELVSVCDSFVVFKAGKWYDTVWRQPAVR